MSRGDVSGGKGGGGEEGGSGESLYVSANQWRMSMLKACIGANVVRGVAEDIADAGLALLALGYDPLPQLLHCLEQFQPDPPQIDWPKSLDAMDLGHLQVLHHGPSLIDLVQAGGEPNLSIDSPLLLLGLAQARLHSHGVGIDVQFDQGNWFSPKAALATTLNIAGSSAISLRPAKSGTPIPLAATHLPQPGWD